MSGTPYEIWRANALAWRDRAVRAETDLAELHRIGDLMRAWIRVKLGLKVVYAPESIMPTLRSWDEHARAALARLTPEEPRVISKNPCYFMFRWGGICDGDHSSGFHSYIGDPVTDAPINPAQEPS